MEKPNRTRKINQALEGKELHLEKVTFVKIRIAQRLLPSLSNEEFSNVRLFFTWPLRGYFWC